MTGEESGSGCHGDGFHFLKTQSRDFLEEIKGRSPCPNCGKSRKFYCYTCYVLMEDVKTKLKQVKLPVKVDIIKHPNEVDGKSTSPHARVVSPDDVTIYTFPCIPEYDREKVILVFPSEESMTLDQLKATESDVTGHLEVGIQRNSSVVHQASDVTSHAEVEMQRSSSVVHQVSDGSSDQRNCSGVTRSCVTKTDDETENDRKRKATESGHNWCDGENKHKKVKDGGETPEDTTHQPDFTDGSLQGTTHQLDFANPVVSDWKCSPCFNRVIFIDSTWLQSKKIFSDERLKGIKQVEIKTRRTKYWRPQGDHPDTYLATIEAIYYFFVDFHQVFISDVYDGDYDNLLFFFLYMYNKVKFSMDSKKTCKR